MTEHEQLLNLLDYNPETGTLSFKNGKEIGWDSGHGYKKITAPPFLKYRFPRDVLSHILIWFYMTGEWSEEIDHINRIKNDNRWSNLRKCTHTQNAQNTPGRANAVSKYKGVSRKDNGWRARITVDKKEIALGTYATEEEAAIVYNEAAKKYFGGFAWLNNINYTVEDYRKITTTVRKMTKETLSSKYKGISWNKGKNKWEAYIRVGKPFYLGSFKDEWDAAEAYNKKAIELLGDTAKLNYKEENNEIFSLA